jgi:hypothetical protein
MQVPFTDPVSATLLFFQTLFLYLHYATTGFWSEDHWGVYFLPSFIALIFLVAMQASEALFEGRKRMVQGLNEVSQTQMSHVLFQMLTGVMLLFTLVLYVFFLDEDTDLPLYWITTSFFATCTLFAITLVLLYQKKSNAHESLPQCPPNPPSKVYIFVAVLAFAQGLFLWLYNSPWGVLMKVPAWVIALPVFVFLGASFYRTLMQTYQKKSSVGPNMIRQFGFLFLILLAAYVVLAVVIYVSDPDIEWVHPKWITLPCVVYSALLLGMAIYVYVVSMRFKAVVGEKKEDPSGYPTGGYTQVPMVVYNYDGQHGTPQQYQFLPGYEQPPTFVTKHY